MTERVTVEYNGELVTVDVQDGTTDEQIKSYLGNDTQTKNTNVNASVNVSPQAVTVGKEMAGLVPEAASAGMNALKQGAQFVANRPLATTAMDVAGIATHGLPIGSMMNAMNNPGLSPKNLLMGPAQGDLFKSGAGLLPRAGSAIAGGARAVGGALAQGLTAPESAFSAPYQMSAYEQEKIRANPTAPQYQTNPYAQQYRGEFPSQGAAGVANARNALINQPYGGLNPEQQQMLQQDRQRQLDIQKQQQKKQQAQVILQQPPTAQNFIQRMTAMSDLYGDVNQG